MGVSEQRPFDNSEQMFYTVPWVRSLATCTGFANHEARPHTHPRLPNPGNLSNPSLRQKPMVIGGKPVDRQPSARQQSLIVMQSATGAAGVPSGP
jgi:hypothetical protein